MGGAALFRLRPAVELLVHLVDAPLGVRVFGLPGLLRRLVALEEAAQLCRDALLLARPALRLIDLSRVDLLDERPDAAVHDGLERRRVVDSHAIVLGLSLFLLEAALLRFVAAVELRLRLVDAAVRVGVSGLPWRLGRLLALEQRAGLLLDALVLLDEALALNRRCVARAQQAGRGESSQEYRRPGVDHGSPLLDLSGCCVVSRTRERRSTAQSEQGRPNL